MSALQSLIFEPIPLLWAELRASLPRAIGLPDPEGSADDDEGLFKRIDRVTPNELQQHLNARTGELLLEIEQIRLLGELHQRAVAAGCGADAPVFAAIERQFVTTPIPQVHSPQGAQ